ncbi:MAG: HEAT repeat domain-containing protein [Acidobacteriota bacterium]
MNCDRLNDLLPDYLAGTLPAAINRELQAHLTECSACGLDVASLEQTWEHMAVLADEQPGESMRSGFYAWLHEAERNAPRPALASRLGKVLAGLWPERPALQFATAAAMMALGIALGMMLRGHPAGPQPPRSVQASLPPVSAPPAVLPASTRNTPPIVPSNLVPTAVEQASLVSTTDADEMHALREEVRSLSHLVALSLLRNDSASDRLQGVSYGREMSASDPRVLTALVEAANRDPNDNVRLAAIDALKPLVGRREVRDRLLHGFDEQHSPLVQIALVDAVSASRDRDVSATLRGLLTHPKLDPAVRQRLETNLGARS